MTYGHRIQELSWGPAAFVLAAALVLLGLNADSFYPAQLGFEAVLAAAILLYAATGRLISGRVPDNAIGWLLALVGLLLAGELLAEQYAVYGVLTSPGSLPAARLVGWSSAIFAVLGVCVLLVLLLLFPDGGLPSRRWRPAGLAIGLVMAGAVVTQMQAGIVVGGGLTDVLDNTGASYPNPAGVFPRHGWFAGFVAVVVVLAAAVALLTVASVFVRRRGASTERRMQLAWLGYVGVLTVLFIGVLLLGQALGGGGPAWLGEFLWILCVLTPVAGVPLACVVAVLKYRLYDIGKIISRTLAYAIVTGLLVGVYAGLVLLATLVLRFNGSVSVAGSTLAAAALFTPLRSRVQRLVDRRFNRIRYDADQTLTAFAARIKDAVDQDAVRADLLGVVHRSLEPTHATVWIRTRS